MDKLVLYIESLVFAAPMPINRKDIRYALENTFEVKIPEEDIERALEELQQKYQSDTFAVEVVEIAEGFQFLTKPAFHHVIGNYLKQITHRRLSRVALETLAIIAYKQPVTKSQLEQIRGVNCDYAIQKLLEKELIEISGRSEGAGRPLVYVTSEKFMDYFGLKNISDLPKLKELQSAENVIGNEDTMEELLELAHHAHAAEADDTIVHSNLDETAESEEEQSHILN
ncbi:MAG TPA: SMC-Scp complex subunit ScpB [Saprospiraceae bacterium]|nr:SMC-Scp complex subunit ScpB [Saprospiraceae bacterium]